MSVFEHSNSCSSGTTGFITSMKISIEKTLNYEVVSFHKPVYMIVLTVAWLSQFGKSAIEVDLSRILNSRFSKSTCLTFFDQVLNRKPHTSMFLLDFIKVYFLPTTGYRWLRKSGVFFQCLPVSFFKLTRVRNNRLVCFQQGLNGRLTIFSSPFFECLLILFLPSEP